MTDTEPKEVSQCDHPVSKIERIDGSGLVHMNEVVYVWGECECGSPTIVKTTIEDVELDATGSVQALQDLAESREEGR